MSRKKEEKKDDFEETQYPVEEKSDKYEGKVEKKYEATPKTKRVVFKHNRSFDLRIGQEVIRFAPHGVNPEYPEKYKDGLPDDIINHRDFESHRNYFVITE